jgi:uncharacterized protein
MAEIDSNASTTQQQGMDAELLEMLRCPLTMSRLRQEGDFLVAEVGGLRYPIREGFPVMLVEEAKLPAGYKNLEEFKAAFKGQVRSV